MDHSTSWIVTDGALWTKLTELRRREIRTWMRMNDIDPSLVPVDSTVTLVEEGGSWVIRFEEFQQSESGAIMIDPKDPDSAYIRECAVPLVIDPPQYWLIPALGTAA
jgi:hypothetical protein